MSGVDGDHSAKITSEEDYKTLFDADATTSTISESVHWSSRVRLKVEGIINLNIITAEGQTGANNDFGQDQNDLLIC